MMHLFSLYHNKTTWLLMMSGLGCTKVIMLLSWTRQEFSTPPLTEKVECVTDDLILLSGCFCFEIDSVIIVGLQKRQHECQISPPY